MSRTPSRRTFLGGAAAATAASLLGCGGSDDGPGGPDGGTGADGSSGADAGTCGPLTGDDIEGPFFDTDSPRRKELVEEGMPGTLLTLSGVVYDQDCQPLASAMLDFWQADDAGVYDNNGFVLRGHQLTDADGRYRLETIVPGRYLNGGTLRPRHIHVKVGGAGTEILTTQLYFDADPSAAGDPWFDPSRSVGVSGEPEDGPEPRLATFDFVLARNA